MKSGCLLINISGGYRHCWKKISSRITASTSVAHMETRDSVTITQISIQIKINISRLYPHLSIPKHSIHHHFSLCNRFPPKDLSMYYASPEIGFFKNAQKYLPLPTFMPLLCIYVCFSARHSQFLSSTREICCKFIHLLQHRHSSFLQLAETFKKKEPFDPECFNSLMISLVLRSYIEQLKHIYFMDSLILLSMCNTKI